jgi:hypothetical protein
MNFHLYSKIFFVLATLSILHTGNAHGQEHKNKKEIHQSANKVPSLKNVFKNHFLIGAAINAAQIEERDTGAAVLVPPVLVFGAPLYLTPFHLCL